MPVYNRAAWVARSVESVFAQSYPRIELLVVDDGSTDDTRRVLETFGSRLTVLTQQHAGESVARNLALEHARGDFVAFIDSDDVWYPHRLACQLPLMGQPEVGLVFGDAVLVEYDGTKPPRRLPRTFFDHTPPSRGRVSSEFARGCFVPFSSVLARRRCFARLGGFTPGYVAADYLKWFEISTHYELDYVDTPVFEYSIHAGGLTYDLVSTLDDRIKSFAAAIERTPDAYAKHQLRRILFNQELHRAIAHLRAGDANAVRALAPAAKDFHGITHRERSVWLFQFIRDQLSKRIRRRVRR